MKNHSPDEFVRPIPPADAGDRLEGLDILIKTLRLYGVSAGTDYGLLRRNGRVLCAIPRNRQVALKVLALYQPQRTRAKLLAGVLRWAACLGLHPLFLRRWKMDGNALGSDTPPGVMVGSSGHQCERAVVVTRESNDWVVTKIAFGPKGEAILGCEATMLERLNGEFVAVPQLLSLEQSPDVTILKMRWQDGRAWQEKSLIPLLALLDTWAGRGEARTLAEYEEWHIVRPLLRQFPAWEQRLTKLADQKFIPSIRHGDLTRPNLRVARDGQLQVHDWERGTTNGLPGLDLVHFLTQDRSFRSEDSPTQVLAHVLEQLQTEPIANWMRSRGWNGLELELMALTFALNTATPYIDQRTQLECLSTLCPPSSSPLESAPAVGRGAHPVTPNANPTDVVRPRVSIVTPSFKQVDFLKRCAASVQDQAGDFRVEHLIQDGGSGQEFDHWAETQTTALCVSEHDDGMYDAINRGFRKASGDIIAWLNCDEQYLPGALERVVRFFDENPTVDILFGDVVLVDEAMTPLAYRRAVIPSLGHIRHSHLSTFSAATFVRRRALDEGHYLQTRWKTISDAVWIEELLAAGYRPAILHEPLAVFCMLGSNLGQSTLLFQERRDWEQQLGTTSKWHKQWHVMIYRLKRLQAGAYWVRRVKISAYTADCTARVNVVRRISGQWSLARNQAANLRVLREGSMGGLALRSRSPLSAVIHAICLVLIAIYMDGLTHGDAIKGPSILLVSLLYLSFRSKLRDMAAITAVYSLTACYLLSERPPDVLITRMVTFSAGAVLAMTFSATLRNLEEWVRSTVALIRNITTPIILTNNHGKVLLINHAACKHLHVAEQKFLNRELIPHALGSNGDTRGRLIIEDWQERPPDEVIGLSFQENEEASQAKARVFIVGRGRYRFYAFTLETSD